MKIVSCVLLLLWCVFVKCSEYGRSARWQVTNSGGNPLQDRMSCVSNYLQMEYGAAEMLLDGTQCDSLPYTWITSPTILSGNVYMQKTYNKVIMQPPVSIYYNSVSDNFVYKTYLPGEFSVGSSVSLTFSPAAHHHKIVINVLDETENVKVLHANMRGDFELVKFGQQNSGTSYQGLENSNGLPSCWDSSACKITFSVDWSYIDVLVDDSMFFQYTHIATSGIPSTLARLISIGAMPGSAGSLLAVEFTGQIDANGT